jgi:anti-sigma factor RsiW
MPHSQALSCPELVELVTEYIEGALSETDRARFETHLRHCEPCRVYLEQMRQTIQALGRLPEESIPEHAKQALLHAFRSWKKNLHG